MATFLSKKGGYKPVKHINGSPYNGQSNIYVVASGQSFVPGDAVKLTGTSVNGYQEVTAAVAAASEQIVGVVVGIVNSKFDPMYGSMSTGTISLDTPQVANVAGQYILVADSPDIVFSVEKAAFAAGDTGANLDVSGAAGGNTVGVSNQICGTGTTAGNFKVIGLDVTFAPLDNSVAGQWGYAQPAAGDTNVRVLVTPAAHVYQGGTVAV